MPTPLSAASLEGRAASASAAMGSCSALWCNVNVWGLSAVPARAISVVIARWSCSGNAPQMATACSGAAVSSDCAVSRWRCPRKACARRCADGGASRARARSAFASAACSDSGSSAAPGRHPRWRPSAPETPRHASAPDATGNVQREPARGRLGRQCRSDSGIPMCMSSKQASRIAASEPRRSSPIRRCLGAGACENRRLHAERKKAPQGTMDQEKSGVPSTGSGDGVDPCVGAGGLPRNSVRSRMRASFPSGAGWR